MTPPYTNASRRRRSAHIGPAGRLAQRPHGKSLGMANYRVIDPSGDVVDTKEFDSAQDAHAWFVDKRADNSELGWRMEAQHEQDGTWHFFDDTEGTG